MSVTQSRGSCRTNSSILHVYCDGANIHDAYAVAIVEGTVVVWHAGKNVRQIESLDKQVYLIMCVFVLRLRQSVWIVGVWIIEVAL